MPARLNKRRSMGLRLGAVLLACHVLFAALAPAIWQGIAAGYPGDSFWTLASIGRLGVVAISITGLGALAVFNYWKSGVILRRKQNRMRVAIWVLDCGIGVAAFGVVYVISPQIFYTLYQMLIPGLPNQWVIDNAARWDNFIAIMIPQNGAPMADHLAGVAIGGIVFFTTYLHITNPFKGAAKNM